MKSGSSQEPDKLSAPSSTTNPPASSEDNKTKQKQQNKSDHKGNQLISNPDQTSSQGPQQTDSSNGKTPQYNTDKPSPGDLNEPENQDNELENSD